MKTQRNFEILEEKLFQNAEKLESSLELFYKEKEIDQLLVPFLDVEKYSLLNGGKRIRPFLTNAVCEMLGGNIEASMPFAMSVEMIHTYSLIHDDLPCMDDDDMRRGKPSNHKVYGEATALLAGDALLTNAFSVAVSSELVSKDSRLKAVTLISRAAGDAGMIGGQIIDLEGEVRKLSLEELILLHNLKTGRMIELSAVLGCLAAGYGENTSEFSAVRSYAQKIGLAFQIVDDILDATGDEETVGKTLRSDSDNMKTTFLTFFDIERAKRYAQSLTKEAMLEISKINGSEILCDLAEYLSVRNK